MRIVMATPRERQNMRSRLTEANNNGVGPRWMREAIARLLDDLDTRDTAEEGEGVSIDAVIGWVHQTEQGLRLDLMPRISTDGAGHSQMSDPGQIALTIVGVVTRRPEPGWAIWGGSGDVEIVVPGGTPWHYDRIGYTRLQEHLYPEGG